MSLGTFQDSPSEQEGFVATVADVAPAPPPRPLLPPLKCVANEHEVAYFPLLQCLWNICSPISAGYPGNEFENSAKTIPLYRPQRAERSADAKPSEVNEEVRSSDEKVQRKAASFDVQRVREDSSEVSE